MATLKRFGSGHLFLLLAVIGLLSAARPPGAGRTKLERVEREPNLRLDRPVLLVPHQEERHRSHPCTNLPASPGGGEAANRPGGDGLRKPTTPAQGSGIGDRIEAAGDDAHLRVAELVDLDRGRKPGIETPDL